MRATASFALLALTTGSANAIFCFVKTQKCLPGVELSLDYDEIPGLLGIDVTKSSTMTGTATETTSASPTLAPSVPAPDTPAVPTPTGAGTGFLDEILGAPKVLAEPSTPLAAPATLVTPAAAPVQAVAAVPAVAPVPAVAAVPAPAAAAPIPAASPSSFVPDWVRNLIPRGYAQIPEAALYQSDAKSHEPMETNIVPLAYSASSEATYYSSASHVAELTSAYVTPVPKVVVTATYSSGHSVDITTIVTELITVTPTNTITLSGSSASTKENHTSAPPKDTAPEKETHEIVLPKPSASRSEVPRMITRTTTITTHVPAPTTLSFSTVASYTSVPNPSEVAIKSYCSPKSKTAIYSVPSNATTMHATTYAQPTEAKATVYVTPIPASYSPYGKTQDMSNPDSPELYTGAANMNALNVFFVMAACAAAVLAL